ncbi:hypothetical protein Hanom_Chr00s000001g01596391 [Helianthus anomalus]
MSSFWTENYFGNRYSNDTCGANDANEEEEVVSGVPVDQKTQLPDLNKTLTPPVDEPNYPAHQVYPDYGYGNRIRVTGYTGVKVDTEVIVDTGVKVDTAVKVDTVDTVDTIDMGVKVVTVDTGVKVDTMDTIDLGVKVDTVDTEATVDTKNMVDMVMSPVTHLFMNHLPRTIRFK